MKEFSAELGMCRGQSTDSPRKGRAQLGGQDGRSAGLRLAMLALSQTRILPRVFGQCLPGHLVSAVKGMSSRRVNNAGDKPEVRPQPSDLIET